MASEDSRYRDRCLRFISSVIEAMTRKTLPVEVRPVLHHLEHAGEPLEVEPFSGSERTFSEERNDKLHQVASTLHGEAQQRMPVVVVPRLLHDPSTTENVSDDLQCGSRWRRLDNCELVLDLPAELTGRVADHRDREASFTVDKADDPLLGTWPFLLIVRTGRIVTAHVTVLPNGCHSVVGEYRRMLGDSSI
jgi:hypothetical protein